MNVRCVCGCDVEVAKGKNAATCPACGRLVTPSVIPPPPPEAYSRRPSPTPLFIIYLVVALLLFIAIACAGIFAAAFIPAFQQAKHAFKREACQENVRDLGMALAMYAAEERDLYPPLPTIPGRIMFGAAPFYPEYLNSPTTFTCPMQEIKATSRPEELIDDESYFYLSHAILNDEQGTSFAEAYREQMRNGLTMEGGIAVAPGKGSNGKDELVPLRRGVENLIAADPLDREAAQRLPGRIPVIVEWPSHHSEAGGNVYYLDGHVEFVKYPGPFPMTKKFIETMRELDKPPPGLGG